MAETIEFYPGEPKEFTFRQIIEKINAGDIASRRWAAKAIGTAGLNQAPAWAGTATVQPFEVRRLTTGVMVIATQAAAGTTSSTEPVVTPGAAIAAITDGTVTWWPLNDTSKPAPQGVAVPTLTDNAGTTSLTVVNIFDNPTLFEQESAPNIFTPGGSGTTKQSIGWAINDGSTADIGAGAGRICKYRTVAFTTSADVIDIGYIATIGTTMVNDRIMIDVDGYPVTEAPVLPAVQGSSRHFKLTIPGGRRNRLIRIRTHGVFRLQSLGVAADAVIRKPVVKGLTSLFCTDSFGDTVLPTVTEVTYDLAPRLSRRLGFSNCAFIGVGGTSYSFDDIFGSGRKALNTLMDTNDFSVFKPDVVVNMHGYNAGNNGVNPSVEAASMTAVLGKQRTLYPSAPILVYGPHYLRPGVTTQMTAVRDAMKTAFITEGDENSAFIDPLDGSITLGNGFVVRTGESTGWINTTNASWALPAAGGVFDGAHLSIAGAAFYEDCCAAAGELALVSLGY